MSDDPKQSDGTPGKPGPAAGSGGTGYFAKKPMPDFPPSKPLQWFLLGAFIITGAAYLVGQWTAKPSVQAPDPQANKIRRLVQNQSDYLAHCKLGNEAFAKKHYDQAVSEIRLALQGQDNAEGHQFLGQALLKKGEPDAALAQFGEALRMNPSLVNAASEWGLALAAQGKPEEARHVLEQALQRNPDSGLLHYNLATTLLQMRASAEGRRRAASAAAKPQEVQAAETDAKNLADDALSHFTKASHNKFDAPAFWCAYGQLLNQLGRHAEAEPLLLRAVSEDAAMTTAQSQLALAEVRMGQYAEAIAHYEKVLVLNPDNTDALNSLALLYATATNAEVRTSKMAVQLAVRACDATGHQNARYMDTLAQSYAADGDFFQAITWEDKAIHRAMQLNDQDSAREFQARQTHFMDHKAL
jgi:tetratricopeptide (TPR) repeat protein